MRARKKIGEEIRREFPKESRRVLRKFYGDEGLAFLVEYIDHFSCKIGRAVPREYRRDTEKIAKHIPEEKTTKIKQNMALTRRISQEFASEAEGIIMKIENGDPFRLGSCDLCPRIHIKQPQSVGASS